MTTRKVMSKEDREREQWIFENAPYINGLTEAEFRLLPEEERNRQYQKFLQIPATFLGYWKTCALAPCRRAKECRGFLSPSQTRAAGYHDAYPPCAGVGAPRQSDMLRALEHECAHLIDENHCYRPAGRKKGGA